MTAKRPVTFPAGVLDALGVKAGDPLELLESPGGSSFGRDASIARGKLRKGQGTFDIEAFREEVRDLTLRD